MLDAYTVRKAIPRIVVAVIAINLSIYLCVAALDITTIVSKGIGQILVSAFVEPGNFKGIKVEPNTENSILGVLGVGGIGAIIGLLIAGGGAAAVELLGLLLPLVITAALMALAILFTLVIWQALVIFLTVISPVAIACYILPGTEKYFKQWWDLYFRTLLVYPIIAILFAMGNVMGSILLGASTSSPDGIGTLQLVAAVVVIIAPLVLIPFAFKMAGGLISQVAQFAGGQASGLSRRAGQAIKTSKSDPDSILGRGRIKRGSNLAARNLSSRAIMARLNPRLRGDDRRGRLAAIRTAYNAKYAGEQSKSIFAQVGAQVDEAQMDMALYRSSDASKDAIRNGSHVALTSTRDEVMKSMYGNNASWDNLDNTQKQAVLSSEDVVARQDQLLLYSSMNDQAGRSKAARVAAAKSGAALSYGYDGGVDGWNQAVAAANDIFDGNDAEVKNFLNEFQYTAKQVGRADLSGNVNSQEYDNDRAWKSVSLYQHANGKPSAIKAFAKQYKQDLLTGNSEQKEQAAIFYKELNAMLPNATGAVADQINRALEDPEVTGHLNTVVSQMDSVQRKARTYERPDPNRVADQNQGQQGPPQEG